MSELELSPCDFQFQGSGFLGSRLQGISFRVWLRSWALASDLEYGARDLG